MTKDKMEYRVYLYAKRYKKLKPGETTPQLNKVYDKLLDLSPERATTYANIVKMDETATFENSASTLTKVWCSGELEENFFIDRNGQERSTVRIRPRIAQKIDGGNFNPRAVFTADVYVEGIAPEMKTN